MTRNVLVASMTLGTIVELSGEGLTPLDAQRHAVNIARGLKHFPDPVALNDDHKSAMIVRRIAAVEAAKAAKMPVQKTIPFFLRRENERYYN